MVDYERGFVETGYYHFELQDLIAGREALAGLGCDERHGVTPRQSQLD